MKFSSRSPLLIADQTCAWESSYYKSKYLRAINFKFSRTLVEARKGPTMNVDPRASKAVNKDLSIDWK